MKALFILLFLSSALFSQENPWKNQGKVNPWGNQTKEVEKKDSVQTTNVQTKTDSVQSVKNQPLKDSIQTPQLQLEKDSGSAAIVQFEMNEPTRTEQQLIEDAQDQVLHEYRSGNDFAIGVTSGLFLNVFALTPDLVYVLLDNKQEKAIQTKIETDSTYSNVDDKQLKSKTRNAVKGKKFLATMGGMAVGSLVQIFFIAAIILAN